MLVYNNMKRTDLPKFVILYHVANILNWNWWNYFSGNGSMRRSCLRWTLTSILWSDASQRRSESTTSHLLHPNFCVSFSSECLVIWSKKRSTQLAPLHWKNLWTLSWEYTAIMHSLRLLHLKLVSLIKFSNLYRWPSKIGSRLGQYTVLTNQYFLSLEELLLSKD